MRSADFFLGVKRMGDAPSLAANSGDAPWCEFRLLSHIAHTSVGVTVEASVPSKQPAAWNAVTTISEQNQQVESVRLGKGVRARQKPHLLNGLPTCWVHHALIVLTLLWPNVMFL